MTFPSDYVERVYAGVLGKIIAVYLGRPITSSKARPYYGGEASAMSPNIPPISG